MNHPRFLVRYCYAGEKFAAADRSYNAKLVLARDMELEKTPDETIRQQTGWFRGRYDHRWRIELPPNFICLDQLEFNAFYHKGFRHWVWEAKATLDALVASPAFRRAYPLVRGTALTLHHADLLDPQAEYRHVQRTMWAQAEDVARLLPYVAHELQHAIQHEEGFATGGNPSDFNRGKDGRYVPYATRLTEYRLLAGEIEAREVQARAGFGESQRRVVAPFTLERYAPSKVKIAYD